MSQATGSPPKEILSEVRSTTEEKAEVSSEDTRSNPREMKHIIDSLGHTHFAQDSELLFQHVLEIYNSPNPQDMIQKYVRLILSTRTKIEDDPELDARLVIAASNAISILNYGDLCGLLDFQLSNRKDWSGIRVPRACLNLAVVRGINFDHADLSKASFYRSDARQCSFRNADLQGMKTYEKAGLRSVAGSDNNLTPLLSGDSRFLVELLKSSIRIWDLETYSVKEVSIPGRLISPQGWAFSPDNRQLALAREILDPRVASKIQIYDLYTGTSETIDHEGEDDVRILSVAFHPIDGSNLVAGDALGRVCLWNKQLSKSKPKLVAVRDECPFSILQFSHDATLLAAGQLNGTIVLLTTDTYTCLGCLKSELVPYTLAFSKTGSHLAISDMQLKTQVFDITRMDEANPELVIFKGDASLLGMSLAHGARPLMNPTVDQWYETATTMQPESLTNPTHDGTALSWFANCAKFGISGWELYSHRQLKVFLTPIFCDSQRKIQIVTSDGSVGVRFSYCGSVFDQKAVHSP